MELWELKDKIQNNLIPNFLIFTGPELGVMDIYIEQIAQRIGSKPKRVDSVSSVLSSSKIITFTNNNKFSIVRGDKSFQTSEKLQSKVNDLKDYLIIIYDSIDKRSKLYKDFQDCIVNFELMDEKTLLSILKRQVELEEYDLKWLMQACGFNYARCLLEINKIKLFNYDNVHDNHRIFEQFRKDGVIHAEIGDVIFQFIDAVTTRKKASSWKLYELLKLKGESNVGILALLYSNFKALLSVQFTNNPTVENTGLTPYQITLNKNKRNIYSDNELLLIIQLINKVDSDIKLGNIEESISVEYLIAKIL